MHNRRSFFRTLAQACELLNVPRDMVIIYGGGASLFYRHREETNDIDVLLDSVYFDQLVKERGIRVTILPVAGEMPALEVFEMFGVAFGRRSDVRNVQYNQHRGFLIMSRLDLLRFRVSMGRDKDIEDIVKLKDVAHLLSIDNYNRMNALLNTRQLG